MAVVEGGLAQQRLGDAAPEHIGEFDQFLLRTDRTGTDQHRDFRTRVEHIGGQPQMSVVGHGAHRDVAHARLRESMLVRRHRHRVHELHVVRHNDACDRAFGGGDADRAIDDVRGLRGRHDRLRVGRHVLEKRVQIHFLQIIAAERGGRLLSNQRNNRHVIEFRVIKTRQQMNRTGARGCDAHADFTRELRMRAGHEGRHFLVAHAYVVERILRAVDGAHQSVDAIARIAEQAADVPLPEPLDDEIADG